MARTGITAVAGLALVLVLAAHWAPAASAATTYTGSVISNEASGYPGPGIVRNDPGVVTGTGTNGAVTLQTGGYSFTFDAQGENALTPGLYTDVGSTLDVSYEPGMRVGGYGICSWSIGDFRLLEAPVVAAGIVQSIAVDLRWRCNGAGGTQIPAGWLHASIRLNAATAPALLSVPTTVELADTTVGESTAAPLTIEAMGRGPSTVSGLWIDGADASMFAIEDDVCTGTTLPGGHACMVTVRFSPTATTPRTATITLDADATQWDHSTRTRGVGRSPLLQVPSSAVLAGEPGHWRAGGTLLVWDNVDAVADETDGSAAHVAWGTGASLLVSAPDGGTLETGHHVIPPTISPDNYNVRAAAEGHGCSYEWGWVDIIEAPVIDIDGALLSFAADFETHCDGSPTVLRGTVRLHSTAPEWDLRPPVGIVEPPTADPVATEEVALDVTATDQSGVEQVSLSNDGETWDTRAYTPQVTWSLVDPAYGGTSADGTKVVSVRWRDTLGTWSDVVTTSITLDRTPPVVGMPAAALVKGTLLTGSSTPVRVTWTGSDASDIAGYELSQSIDGGAWSTPVAVSGGAATVALATAHSYRFQVRGTDGAGNPGSWVAGPAFALSGISQRSSAITYLGTWRTATHANFWGGSLKGSSETGAKARLPISARGIAWVARVGPTRGKAVVYVNGAKVATVDLYSATWQSRRIVWTASWATATTRTVTIRVSGTSGRPRVELDGYVVLR